MTDSATNSQSGAADAAPDTGVADEVTSETHDTDGDISTGDTNEGDINTEAANDPSERNDAPSGKPGDSRADADATHDGGAAADANAILAAERLNDLQRLQAEYVNYKRRVDRDRALVQEKAVADVIDSMLPVLDDIHLARQHGDLTDGPFAAIADKLEASLGKFGLERFGTQGEAFDPTRHEALLHAEWDDSITPEDAEATTIVQALQPGYRAGERIIRPARVSVADPS